MKDWRGNEFDVGSTVVYARMSGRSVEVSEAIVAEIYEVYRDDESWDWKRIKPGVELRESQKTETRIKLQPTGPGSRDFLRWSDHKFVEDENGKFQRIPQKPRAVTLQINNNITVVEPRSSE